MRIDAHQHFWNYSAAEYPWINDKMAIIRRDFFPRDLGPEISAAGIDRVIAVQARQSTAETRWLLELARTNSFIAGVVGWVDLRSPKAGTELESFALDVKLKGVRHVLQAELDPAFLEGADFNRGIRELKRFGLAYDLLISASQLGSTINFVDVHPTQIFVLDHAAKPFIRDGLLEPWRRELHELAKRPNVYCKLSGLVTEADFDLWTNDQLFPYFAAVLDAFGPNRVMFGSDWPVCNVACSYARWHALVAGWISTCSQDEQNEIFGGTAVKAYRL